MVDRGTSVLRCLRVHIQPRSPPVPPERTTCEEVDAGIHSHCSTTHQSSDPSWSQLTGVARGLDYLHDLDIVHGDLRTVRRPFASCAHPIGLTSLDGLDEHISRSKWHHPYWWPRLGFHSLQPHALAVGGRLGFSQLYPGIGIISTAEGCLRLSHQT